MNEQKIIDKIHKKYKGLCNSLIVDYNESDKLKEYNGIYFKSSIDPKLTIQYFKNKLLLDSMMFYYNGERLEHSTSSISGKRSEFILKQSELLLKEFFKTQFKELYGVKDYIVDKIGSDIIELSNLEYRYVHSNRSMYRNLVVLGFRFNENAFFNVRIANQREIKVGLKIQNREMSKEYYVNGFYDLTKKEWIDDDNLNVKGNSLEKLINTYLNLSDNINKKDNKLEEFDNITNHPVEEFNILVNEFIKPNIIHRSEIEHSLSYYNRTIKKINNRLDLLSNNLNLMKNIIDQIEDSFLKEECVKNHDKCSLIFNKQFMQRDIITQEYLKYSVKNISNQLENNLSS